MEVKKFGVATFHSTSHAIQAEKVCRGCGIEVKLIPTPRRISSDCGVSLRFFHDDRDAVLAALGERNVEISLVTML
ncbi:MAG: DUF3343 domain-containing protein [Smithellaceae bacterium]|nr:DUF3343 domain-containing protein [Smithellaceae bacterium]